jgi:hypothetical protein
MLTERPQGRWIALGWAILTLAGGLPLEWQYRQLAGETDSLVFLRLLDVGLALAGVTFVGSLLPLPFRAGLFIGFVKTWLKIQIATIDSRPS